MENLERSSSSNAPNRSKPSLVSRVLGSTVLAAASLVAATNGGQSQPTPTPPKKNAEKKPEQNLFEGLYKLFIKRARWDKTVEAGASALLKVRTEIPRMLAAIESPHYDIGFRIKLEEAFVTAAREDPVLRRILIDRLRFPAREDFGATLPARLLAQVGEPAMQSMLTVFADRYWERDAKGITGNEHKRASRQAEETLTMMIGNKEIAEKLAPLLAAKLTHPAAGPGTAEREREEPLRARVAFILTQNTRRGWPELHKATDCKPPIPTAVARGIERMFKDATVFKDKEDTVGTDVFVPLSLPLAKRVVPRFDAILQRLSFARGAGKQGTELRRELWRRVRSRGFTPRQLGVRVPASILEHEEQKMPMLPMLPRERIPAPRIRKM